MPDSASTPVMWSYWKQPTNPKVNPKQTKKTHQTNKTKMKQQKNKIGG